MLTTLVLVVFMALLSRRVARLRQVDGLLGRYRARAARSVSLSELDSAPWADRPYGALRPEDVGA